MRDRPPIHPGEILKEEFMVPLKITQYSLAQHLGVQQTRVSQIVNGKRGITPDTAVRLSTAFHTTPEFWLNLQSRYDLEVAQEAAKNIRELCKALKRFKSRTAGAFSLTFTKVDYVTPRVADCRSINRTRTATKPPNYAAKMSKKKG